MSKSAKGIAGRVRYCVTPSHEKNGYSHQMCAPFSATERRIGQNHKSDDRTRRNPARLGRNRFTASAAEGYFTSVLRIGVRLLFYYAVLAVGMQIVAQWQSALAAACKPVSATVPLITSYYVPPSSIVTTVCSGSIPATDMFYYEALAAVFAALSARSSSMNI
jgi:hypothetical protein